MRKERIEVARDGGMKLDRTKLRRAIQVEERISIFVSILQFTLPRIIIRHRRITDNAQALDKAFVSHKEECPVFSDTATEHATILVTLERIGRRSWVEEIARIEGRIAMEIEESAVIIIRTCTCDGIDDAARSAAELRRVSIGQNLELAYRFHTQQHTCHRSRGLAVDIVYVCAIEQEVVLLGPCAID